jgi:HEAT repeat protein
MPSLLAYHIGRLRDKNPRVRAASARELGLLGDPDALEALETLFRVEIDPDVKVAVQEAGRILYKKRKLQEE